MGTSSRSGFAVVSDGLTANYRSQSIGGTGCSCNSLFSSGLKSAALATGLVQPDSHVALPMLPQMDVRNHVVVLNHELFYKISNYI
jgi:hypothetical protein